MQLLEKLHKLTISAALWREYQKACDTFWDIDEGKGLFPVAKFLDTKPLQCPRHMQILMGSAEKEGGIRQEYTDITLRWVSGMDLVILQEVLSQHTSMRCPCPDHISRTRV